MESKVKSPAGNALVYGIITGVAMIIFMLILITAKLFHTTGVQYLQYIIVILGMVMGTLNYRNKTLGGYINYGGAFYSNFLIGLFSSIVYIIFFFIYVQYINPGFIDDLMQITREQMESRAGSMSEDDMDRAMEMSQRFMSPVMLTIFGFLGSVLWSTIIALVVAIFLKKKDNTPMSQQPSVSDNA